MDLPPLPYLDPGHRMTHTRIISLNMDGSLGLYLLGGDYYLSSSLREFKSDVFELLWYDRSPRYNWTNAGELDSPSMSE